MRYKLDVKEKMDTWSKKRQISFWVGFFLFVSLGFNWLISCWLVASVASALFVSLVIFLWKARLIDEVHIIASVCFFLVVAGVSMFFGFLEISSIP